MLHRVSDRKTEPCGLLRSTLSVSPLGSRSFVGRAVERFATATLTPVAYRIVFNARADRYLDSLPAELAERIEDALDALGRDPSDYEAVQFKTAFIITVAGHDIVWTYSRAENELIVASIRPFS